MPSRVRAGGTSKRYTVSFDASDEAAARIEREADERPPATSCSGIVGRSMLEPVDAARARERVDDVQIAAASKASPCGRPKPA